MTLSLNPVVRAFLDHRDDRHPHQCISTSGTDLSMSTAGSYPFTAVVASIASAQKQPLHDIRGRGSQEEHTRRYLEAHSN
jgi:hypothetical protein